MSQDGFILDPPSNGRELSDWCFSSLLKLLTTIESWALFPHYQTGIIAETSPVWRIQGRLTFQSEHGGIWVTTTMSFLAGCLLATVLCVWRSFQTKLWHHKKMRSIGVPNKFWCEKVIRGRLLVNKWTVSIFYLDCCFLLAQSFHQKVRDRTKINECQV